MLSAGNETRDVRHIDHEERAVPVRDLAHDLAIDGAGIGGGAGDEQFGVMLLYEVFHMVIVDAAGGGIDAVADAAVDLAGEIDGRAVAQVAAVGKIHAHERIARLEQGGVDLQIGLRAGMRLDVGKLRAEKRLGALDGQRLQLVGVDAAAVVALAGVALGVFVGQDGAHGGDDGGGGDVLRGDQLDVLVLTVVFALDHGGDLRVEAVEIGCVLLKNIHGAIPFLNKK